MALSRQTKFATVALLLGFCFLGATGSGLASDRSPGSSEVARIEPPPAARGPHFTTQDGHYITDKSALDCEAYGDVNNDGIVNITDLTYLIDWLFMDGAPPDSIWEADLNGDCIIDTLDAYALTCVLFQGCPTPVPTCCEPTPIVYGQGESIGQDTAYALGDAAVVVQDERSLQINNVGGSGYDGIRLQVSDSTRTIATKLDNINLNQDSAGFRLNVLAHVSDPAKDGEIETQWVSLIGAFNQIGYIEVLANFNALGDPNVTMMVYQNKFPVGQVVIPDGGLIAIGTEGIPSIGLPACTTVVLHADSPPTFVLYFNKLIRFETVAGPIMFGDELRVIAAGATKTLHDINAFDINGYYLGWFALTDWEAARCCWGFTGNTDYDLVDLVDLSDLIYLVNYLFLGGPMPVCMPEANVTGDLDCAVDLSDLIHLVNFLFLGGPIPEPCLQECDEGP
ncbi:dockerin type I repeat-containing protein [bacterium]|nr:dockerin type I repeat-containing protein [bacterium]